MIECHFDKCKNHHKTRDMCSNWDCTATEKELRYFGHTFKRPVPIREGINNAVSICHGDAVSAGWWTDLETGEPLARNKGELMMLMVSELAEMMEGVRKDLPDEKLPHRRAEEVELADALIRMFDYAGAFGLDLGGAVEEKLMFNRERCDHKAENRKKAHGKKF